MKIARNWLLIVVILLTITSCKDEYTDVYPTVNNIESGIVTAYDSDWHFYAPSWELNVDYDAITRNIHDYGAVLVYLENSNTWRQLPLTFYSQEGDNYNYSSTIEVSTYVGGVTIYWTDSDFVQPVHPGTRTFKIVVISPEAYQANPDVNYSDFNEVAETFNLER